MKLNGAVLGVDHKKARLAGAYGKINDDYAARVEVVSLAIIDQFLKLVSRHDVLCVGCGVCAAVGRKHAEIACHGKSHDKRVG